MRLLIDTNIFIGMVNRTLASGYPHIHRSVSEHDLYLSVVSIWEIAIKVRIGKLTIPVPMTEITAYCTQSRIAVLPIEARHATASLEMEPKTNDPFDRLLLCQCQVEGMNLVTLDRALLELPLAFLVRG
jgi:PIN domain nuclease of toxin-antitoxin system